MEETLTIDEVIIRLTEGPPLRWGVYGDGEFYCMTAPVHGKANGQGETYTPELADALKESITSQNLDCYGLAPGRVIVEQCAPWIAENLPVDEIRISEHLPIRHAMHNGEGGKLIKTLRGLHSVLVGPKHLKDLDVINHDYFVECPLPNAFNKINNLVREINKLCAEAKYPIDVVLLSCGMSAAVIAARLDTVDVDCSVLDCGSVWDPYVKVNSRKLMHTEVYQNRMKKNLKEAE